MRTYKYELMVQNHGAIATIDVRNGLLGVRQHRLVLNNSSGVGVTLPDMMLASGKMAIDEADRRVIHDKPRDDTTLYEQSASAPFFLQRLHHHIEKHTPCSHICHPSPA